MKRCRRPADDRGQIAGIEAVTFGTLIFVLGTLVVANAWGVVDAKLAATAAAREAARAFVEAPSAALAHERSQSAARATISGYGRSIDRMEGPTIEGSFERCRRVKVSVRYRVPVILVPVIGGMGRGFTVTGRHSEVVDPYRSGLPGASTCG